MRSESNWDQMPPIWNKEMTVKQQAYARAQELRCKILDNGDYVQVEAPDGYVFSGIGCHVSMMFIYGNGAWKKADIWKALIEDYMDLGLDPCEDPDCDCLDGVNQQDEKEFLNQLQRELDTLSTRLDSVCQPDHVNYISKHDASGWCSELVKRIGTRILEIK